MKNRKLILALASPVALLIALAAQAQGVDRTDDVVDEVAAFERDVDDAAEMEILPRRDTSYLRSRAKAIRAFFNKVSRDGLSLPEAQLVRDRISYLRTRYSLQRDE